MGVYGESVLKHPESFHRLVGLADSGLRCRDLGVTPKTVASERVKGRRRIFLLHLFAMVRSQQPVWLASIQEGPLRVFVFS